MAVFKMVLVGCGALVGGYLLGLFGGMLLINLFSPNSHDRGMEAAMTSAFVIGPITAILAAILTFMLMPRS
jgi:hypothetical protein